jgi:hypothetical protein
MALTTKIRGNTQIVAGSITNAEINATASIAESKLLFNTSTGHDHDGANSKSIAASAVTSHFVYNEIPSGTINGTNTVFVLANAPADNAGVDASLDVYLNGVHLRPGTSATDQDYFINANATVTTTFIPTSGDVILVSYIK